MLNSCTQNNTEDQRQIQNIQKCQGFRAGAKVKYIPIVCVAELVQPSGGYDISPETSG